MKVLPKKEFRELATEQKFLHPESLAGFIDKETHEVVIPRGARTRLKLHELGHQELEHFPKAVKFYGKGRKDVTEMYEPWRQAVDDEIEAEIYSYKLMGKRLTPRVGMMALRVLMDKGWDPYRALSLVIGRLKHYRIKTSLDDRMDMVGIIEMARGVEIEEYKGWGQVEDE